MTWRAWFLTFTGLCAVTSLTVPAWAVTKSRLFPGTQCDGVFSDSLIVTNGQLLNPNHLSQARMLCPVTTDSTFEPTIGFGGALTVTISVDGWNRAGSAGTDGIRASACRVFRNGTGAGGVCGTPAGGGSAGAVVHLAPSATTTWINNADAKFILVSLAEKVGGAMNVIWSYKVTYTQ